MGLWDDYYHYIYSSFGITGDMTEEEFGKAFKSAFLYSPEGDYLAYISFDSGDGDTIAVLHRF